MNFSLLCALCRLFLTFLLLFLSGEDDAASDIEPVFPFAKPLAQLQEQIVAPETHFVYALTW